MAMRIDRHLILQQILSPAFPVGGYAHSQGIEGAGLTSSSLSHWLRDVLEVGAGRSDAVLLASAQSGAVTQADRMAHALAPSRDRLEETLRQGAAFIRHVNATWALSLPPLAYPVAVGAAAAALDLPRPLTAATYLAAGLSNLSQAAIRLQIVTAPQAQTICADLAPLCAQIADRTATATPDDAGGSAWLADIAAMHHETFEPRLFLS